MESGEYHDGNTDRGPAPVGNPTGDHAADNVNKVRYHFNVEYPEGTNSLSGVEILQIGDLSCDGNYRVMEHVQWCHEISFILSGEAMFYIDGHPFHLSSGSLCISPQGSTHAIEALSHMRYAYLGFNIDYTSARNSEEADFLLQLNRALMSSTELVLPDSESIYNLFSMLLDEFYSEQRYSEVMKRSLLIAVLLKVLRTNPQYRPPAQAPTDDQYRSGVVYQIIRYVENNYLVSQTVESLADKMGYSKYYLSHMFKDATGTTLQQFMLKTRMRKAKELLGSMNQTVSDVAQLLDYTNTQSFSRSFKKFYGLSPREYRESIKQGSDEEGRSPDETGIH